MPELNGRRPLRVCYLIDRLRTGGTETQLVELIKHLDRRRIQPYLCLLDGEDSDSQRLEPTCCEVARFNVRSLARSRTIVQAYRFAKLLREWEIDILQVFFPDSTYFGVAAARAAGVRCVVRSRRDLFYWVTPVHKRWGRFIDGLYNRFLVDAMIVNSNAVRDYALRDENPPPRKIGVISNGVDLERFPLSDAVNDCADQPDGLIRVGTLAMLRPEKRLDLLIRAARHVVDELPQVQFLIAGEGPERRSLENLVQQLRLERQVTLTGLVSDISGFLSQLNIGVLCSESEGLSNSLIEYMAARLPVVATAVGGNIELVEPGITGLLVRAHDAEDLAAAIKKLVQSPRDARRMGMRGRAVVEERFAFEVVAGQHAAFYESLLEGRATEAMLSPVHVL